MTSGGVTGIPCPERCCESLISPSYAKRCLSEWEVMRMAEREESRNERVALSAKAVLRCNCGRPGSVGTITEEDVGNGSWPVQVVP